ncbi:MAG: leucine--tRNA ligase [Candidatus Nomurabacteria bacterium]|jgi:leucyl-tRNA synthetase|nr:leucine--tRNA ligase [Candidatus Nomurabacteria bacterium]
MKRYNPQEIEAKWQKVWDDTKAFEVDEKSSKLKSYIAEMFPYPSGYGLHVGHVRNFMIVDAIARFYRQLGHNVMRPFGYDTFGLPAENYAIKTGLPPQETTLTNINHFREQFKRMGMAVDWSREINTSDPEYYRWTQWIFTRLYEKGLAYQAENLQWWCPHDKTVLANEQVEGGKCWRCGNEVKKKRMKQWFFKITAYADELLDEIDNLDWPEKIKTMQRNWIGRSQGAEIKFVVKNTMREISVFTTRPDTIFGATFMVLAPEHPLINELVNSKTRAAVNNYCETAMRKTEVERQENREKTGVFTGSYAINPATGEEIPIWVADYVLSTYGEGAIMAVPAHDERDYEFATKFSLPIKEVVKPHFIDSVNTPIDGKEWKERRACIAIVHDPKTDKYLCVEWLKQPWTAFVIGGMEPEDDGDIIKTAEREVHEETGYRNLKFKQVLPGEVVVEFYAQHKGINRRALYNGVLFELVDDERDELSADEEATQRAVWLNYDQIMNEPRMTGFKDQILYLERALGQNLVWTGEGDMINSGQFDGMESAEASEEIVAWLEEQGVGKSKVTYRMRDWLISRQRYWGCPIPIAYDAAGKAHLIPNDQLPVLLPKITDYQPDDSGRSALAKDKDWLKVTIDGEEMTRETDTMDGYACSSWYLLRYADPQNVEEAWSKSKVDYWNPVDFYVGGDHAVAHLLYVRFWCKFFADEGLLSFREPVKRLLYNGYINAPDGKKMSKSKGNVIDPIDIIDQGYGADALRTYELFIGPYELDAAWDPRGIGGVYRFLNRAWTVVQEYLEANEKGGDDSAALMRAQHSAVKRVTEDMYRNSFNTAVAALMEYVNELYKLKLDGFNPQWQEALEVLVKLLAPFAPHLACELFEQLGHEERIEDAGWPEWDDKYLVADEVELVVQVNGKVRAKIMMAADELENETVVLEIAKGQENVQAFINGKQIIKTIYVKKNRLVNIVVK